MNKKAKWRVYQTTPLVKGKSYIIFNEGNNGENIFRDKRDMQRFKRKFKEYFNPFLKIDAFCLLRNHFHIKVSVRKKFLNYNEKKYHYLHKVIERYKKTSNRNEDSITLGELMRIFYMSYAKYFNRKYNRKGSLFRKNYKRIILISKDDEKRAIVFIHRNPQKHGLINNFRDYIHSSYQIYKDQKKWLITSNKLFYNLFGNLQTMEREHDNHDDNNNLDIQIED